jgi:YegS/Rv2252/BmrU family lipid kinase
MPQVHIIANPVAGGGRGHRTAQTLVEALAARGIAATLFETSRAGDAWSEAARVHAPIVAVVGGDGTLNEVLNGLPEGSPTALAICPVGTANVVARALGMTGDSRFTANAISGGRTIPMDIGLHGERRFLLGAGAGLDAAVTRAVEELRGQRSSLAKWVLPALKMVARYSYPGIRVAVDGEVIAEGAGYVIVGNCRNSAGIFPATPRAELSDGLLDVCAFTGLSLPRLAWLLVNVWRPGYIEQPWIAYRQGRDISLEPAAGEPAAPLQVDGDSAGVIPASFTVAPWRVNMVVAPSSADAK